MRFYFIMLLGTFFYSLLGIDWVNSGVAVNLSENSYINISNDYINNADGRLINNGQIKLGNHFHQTSGTLQITGNGFLSFEKSESAYFGNIDFCNIRLKGILTYSGNLYCLGMILENGSSLTVNTGNLIQLSGNLILNEGCSFLNNGTLLFLGDDCRLSDNRTEKTTLGRIQVGE